MAGKRVGWLQIVLGLIALGLIIKYWYVAIPVIAVSLAGTVWRRRHLQAVAHREAVRQQTERDERERADRGAELEVERSAETRRLARQARRYASLEAASRSHALPIAPVTTPDAVAPRSVSEPTAGSGSGPPVGAASAHDFDVALSFAGEDRAIATAVAGALRSSGVRVFYDEFLAAELWGEDMVVYFDEVFRKRARYVVAFVSHQYVVKPWTNLERRSAQARFLTEDAASFLPVRLDSSEIPGMPPTIGYVDFRTIGIDGVVNLILDKLGSRRVGGALASIDHVPRTVREEALLLATRPPAWEYLLFAAVILRERDALDAKWRDYVIGYAQPRGASLDDREAAQLISTAMRHAQMIGENIERVLTPQAVELAVGRPGEPGDPVQIEHLAKRLIDCYRAFLDWSEHLRSAATPERFDRAVELASSFADGPIAQIREFVDLTVADLDQLPARLRDDSDERIELRFTLTLSITDGLVSEFNREMDRLSH
jgi:hypothetical protein